jgi:hypothetical protein
LFALSDHYSQNPFPSYENQIIKQLAGKPPSAKFWDEALAPSITVPMLDLNATFASFIYHPIIFRYYF